MKSATNAQLKDSVSTELPVSNQPYQVSTRVIGSGETGITVVDEKGEGLFIPDTMGTQLPKYSGGDRDGRVGIGSSIRVAVEDLYPHWQESKTNAGAALLLVSNAIDDLQTAIESNCSGDIERLNYLVLAETQLFQALLKSGFNKPVETVISFCAWGLRNVAMSPSVSPSLSGLTAALKEIREAPFMDMNRATRLIMDLEDQGWSDVSPMSHAFEAGMSAFDSHEGHVV